MFTAPPARAQQVAAGDTGTGPAPAASGSSGYNDSQAERVIVTDVPIEESILPTTRPYTAAFGLDDNILDVPRNVTIISREQLDSINLDNVRDFDKLTSSSYTTTNFGAPANPSLRGTTADVLLNGQRRGLTSNGNGLPLDFNQVESVSILKGPAPAIYGASQYVGGFIDLVTKRPYFDKFQGTASGTVGIYDQNRWTLDFGGPIIKDKLAFRISYSGEESGSFYENGNTSTQAVYGALTYMPNEKYKLELNASFFQADYVENFGVNRPTQDLIDNGRYISGGVIDQNGDGVRDNHDVNSGGNAVLPTGTIDLNRSRRLLAPGDGSFGREIEGQAIQTLNVNEYFTLVNNLYANYIKRDTRSSYYYSEIVDNDYVVDDRTEFQGKFETTLGGGHPKPAPKDGKGGGDDKDAKKVAEAISNGIKLVEKFNFGIDFRYQHTLAYDNYFNEPSNTWDLSAPLADFVGVEEVMTLVSGYLTNVTVIAHIMGSRGVIYLDELSHNSIISGCRGSGSEVVFFRHNDLAHLDELMTATRAHYKNALIVSESLFSMDGDIVDLPVLVELKKKHATWLLLDEAHSIGVLGDEGRGLCEYTGVDPNEIDLIIGTLSKSFASCGGFVCAKSSVINWFRHTLPGFVYSVGLSPVISAAALTALELAQAEPWRLERLRRNSELFAEYARERGLDTGPAIGRGVVPILFKDSYETLAASAYLNAHDYYVPPIIQVGVPKDQPRLRFFLSAAHTEAEIRGVIDQLVAFRTETRVPLDMGDITPSILQDALMQDALVPEMSAAS